MRILERAAGSAEGRRESIVFASRVSSATTGAMDTIMPKNHIDRSINPAAVDPEKIELNPDYYVYIGSGEESDRCGHLIDWDCVHKHTDHNRAYKRANMDQDNMGQEIAKTIPSRDVTRKGAARVVEIARAGAELLLDEGFTAVTKRRVAKRLGIAHGNVGYYFPTRETLWRAVIDYEISELDDKYPIDVETDTNDPQSRFDEYLSVYMVSYEDRKFGYFFAHLDAYAEINAAAAKLRDETYERVLQRIIERVRPLCPTVDDERIEMRALTVMALLEGLGSVAAFRPELVIHNSKFRQQMIDKANAIIRGD